MSADVTMESFRVEGQPFTEVRLRISDKVLAGADLNELERIIIHQAGRPEASIADNLLALEALVRAAEKECTHPDHDDARYAAVRCLGCGR